MNENNTQNVIPNVDSKSNEERNVPDLREYYLFELADINPKNDVIKEEFIYIDLESVNQGILCQKILITKDDAPSRAQRTVKLNDILFQTVRPYQKNNYIMKEHFEYQVVASTGYALLRPKINPLYLYYLLHSKKFNDEVINRCTGTSFPAISSNDLKVIKCRIHNDESQKNIGNLLCLLDKRIYSQKKIIDNLNSLINSIINHIYSNNDYNVKLNDIITQSTNRNKNELIGYVSSVSNKYGFIKQSEQFEDRDVASDDLTNYKVVTLNDFGYNPARINVGSIARYKNTNDTVVSPMYICFKCKNTLYPEYLEYYFKSNEFKINLLRRLEGSVRQCLTFESMQNIPFYIPDLDEQKKNAKIISAFFEKIQLETSILNKLILQKDYLLSKMFI